MRRGVELGCEQNVLAFDGLLKIALAEAEAAAGDPDRAVAILDEALVRTDRPPRVRSGASSRLRRDAAERRFHEPSAGRRSFAIRHRRNRAGSIYVQTWRLWANSCRSKSIDGGLDSGSKSALIGAQPSAWAEGGQSASIRPDRLLEPAQRSRLLCEEPSPFDGSLRPDEPPDARPLDPREALRQRQELAPGSAGRYRRGNCPGCGNAPIEACCKADGLRFVLDITQDYCYRSSRRW
jgi:hypothetical protein